MDPPSISRGSVGAQRAPAATATAPPLAAARTAPAAAAPAAPAAAATARGGARSADQRLDDVESVARIGSYALDIRTGRWVSSRGLDAIFGIDASFERSVEGWASLIHPLDRETMVAYFADEVVGRARPFDREYRIVRADTGEVRWTHGRGVLELDASGRPRRMLGTIADVTEQRRAQESLRESELRYAAIFEGAIEAILVAELATLRIRWANPAACDLLGHSREELLGLTVRDIHPADGFPAILDRFRGVAAGSSTLSRAVPCRRKDGTILLADVRASPAVVDGMACIIGFFRDVTDRHRAEFEAHQLAAVVEQSANGIVITDPAFRIVYTNAAYATSVGRGPSELVGRSAQEVVAIGLDETTVAEMYRTVSAGKAWITEVDHRNPDGTLRRFEANVAPTHDADGGISSWVGVIRDVTERRQAEANLASSEERLRTALDTMLEGVSVMSAVRDDDGRIVDFRVDHANAAIGEISRVPAGRQIGQSLLELFPAHRTNGLFDAYVRVVETGAPFESGPFHYVDPGASGGPLDQVLEHRAARTADGYVLSVRDITERHRAEAELRRLATAIEQSADAVVITDADARIEYVNPAFEQVSGYTREEALGQNPRILKSGVQGPAFYAAMWAALASGQSFVGDLTNRRKDGSLFQEEAVISPIRADDGEITSYVAVKRDVTRERALEATQERTTRERALIAGILAELQVLPDAAATAESICRQVVSMAGITSAALFYFSADGRCMALAFVRADGGPTSLRRIPFQRSRRLRERAEEGPWVEGWPRRPWNPYDRVFRDLGVSAQGIAPVRHAGRLVGLLSAASGAANAIERLTESLPALLEFAGFAGALVGPSISDLTEVGRVRERIAEIIRTGAFHPVFQPVVDLVSGAHVGYEALTRFSSGTAPDLVFADSRAAGLGVELELATLGAAIASAAGLPRGGWLSLNVSPGLLTANGRLAGVLRRADRPVVLEITEHVPIDDYAALRAAIGRLRREVRLAVDDAGSGIANFSHIVELRPAFVKLDIGLVRGIDADLTRQALMVGLLHFARESGSQTIAEGVETEAELATLRRLGVPLAQGFLLGRPQPVAS